MAASGVAYYRSRKGLKQAELAVTLGTSEPRMSRIERGEEIPSAEELDKIVAALEVPPSWLFSKHILAEIVERERGIPGTATS